MLEALRPYDCSKAGAYGSGSRRDWPQPLAGIPDLLVNVAGMTLPGIIFGHGLGSVLILVSL